jgi:cytochrome P450
MFRRLFAPFPTWRWYRTRADRALDASVVKVNEAIEGFVAAARERLADPARRAAPANLLEAMIVAADDPGSGITPGEVAGNVMTMLLAGEDTTANTLAWATWLLFTHPEALAKARAEVDAVAGDPAAWTHERFAEMRWLEACANETMRIKPVAPSLTLLALRDTTVADIRVPGGTLVFLAMRSDSLREACFASAATFDPQRWLEPDAGPSATSANRVSMPFGAGPRVCPGRHLAMLEMKMALATLIGRFEIESVGTPEGGEPDELMSFAMGPSRLAMRLGPRRRGA